MNIMKYALCALTLLTLISARSESVPVSPVTPIDRVVNISSTETLTLDAAFRFGKAINVGSYSGWYLDFTISFDQAVAKSSVDLYGKSGSYWKRESMGTGTYAKDVEYRVFDTNETMYKYSVISLVQQEFYAGIINHSIENLDKTVTVRLKLINPSNLSQSVTLGYVKHMFGTGRKQGTWFDLNIDKMYSLDENKLKMSGCRLTTVGNVDLSYAFALKNNKLAIDTGAAIAIDKTIEDHRHTSISMDIVLTPTDRSTIETFEYSGDELFGISHVRDGDDEYLTGLAAVDGSNQMVRLRPMDGEEHAISDEEMSHIVIDITDFTDGYIVTYSVNNVVYGYDNKRKIKIVKNSMHKRLLTFHGTSKMTCVKGDVEPPQAIMITNN